MAKNTHLTHIEDRILTDGLSGGQEAIKILKMMGDFLSGAPGPKPLVTEKWDGAPAVIVGVDPADNQFFVGTKSVFAKTNPKICKSENDINRMYSGRLAQKLTACFREMNGKVEGVLQGDLMFTDDKTTQTIDGRQMVTFRPNTLTYAARTDSPLGRQIQQAKLGIVFHTKYTGTSLDSMSAGFNVLGNEYKFGSTVWAQKATYEDISGAANMTVQERAAYDAAVRRTEGSLAQTRSILNTVQSGKKALKIDTELLKFFNGYVKQGQNIPSVDQAYNDFMIHMGRETGKIVDQKKTIAAQEKNALKFLEAIDFLEKNEKEFKMLIALYMNITYCKNILVKQLQKVQALRVFADINGNYVATTPEGFVAVQDDRAVKLIDRLEFSKMNFTIPKNWDK